MRGTPKELTELLEATGPQRQELAWASFVGRYSSLILKTARSKAQDYDAAMDRYRYVLEQLRAARFRRLRAYVEDPRAEFTSWLIVVINRLCMDYHRKRYGRAKSDGPTARHTRLVRRRLADLVTEDLDDSHVAVARELDPEADLRRRELQAALDNALDGATMQDRLLLRLRFEDGLSVRQIAGLMGYRNVFQVYRRLKALTEHLRRRLEDQGISDPRP
jgi:RNA polymerase sigma factor (sigma-70 family)